MTYTKSGMTYKSKYAYQADKQKTKQRNRQQGYKRYKKYNIPENENY